MGLICFSFGMTGVAEVASEFFINQWYPGLSDLCPIAAAAQRFSLRWLVRRLVELAGRHALSTVTTAAISSRTIARRRLPASWTLGRYSARIALIWLTC